MHLLPSFTYRDVSLNFEYVGRWVSERLISSFVSPTMTMPRPLPPLVHLMSDGPLLICLPNSTNMFALCHTSFTFSVCRLVIGIWGVRHFASFSYRDVSLNSGYVGWRVGWVSVGIFFPTSFLHSLHA